MIPPTPSGTSVMTTSPGTISETEKGKDSRTRNAAEDVIQWQNDLGDK